MKGDVRSLKCKRIVNLALLGKWQWWLISNDVGLWRDICHVCKIHVDSFLLGVDITQNIEPGRPHPESNRKKVYLIGGECEENPTSNYKSDGGGC